MRWILLLLVLVLPLTACDVLSLFELPEIQIIKPHTGYLIEWWYQTGVLNDGEYSYELTVFRSIPNKWLLHVVLHDHVNDKRFFLEKVLDPSKMVLETNDGFGIAYSDNEIHLKTLWNVSKMEMVFKCDDFMFDLTLKPKKGWIPHGENGVVDMAAGKSYYYSLTNVDVRGEIRIGKKMVTVSGKTWIDRQWGNFSAHPWDWFSFRLEGDIELMVFSFPGKLSHGTLIHPDGSFEYFEDAVVELVGFFEFEGKEIPIPPATVIVPEFDIELTAVPVSKDQFNPARYTPPYWEGLCKVYGYVKGEEVSGWAFFEGWR